MASNSDSPIIFIAALEGVLFEFIGVEQAFSYTLSETFNILSGKSSSGGLEDLKAQMSKVTLDTMSSSSQVFHLFYEAGLALEARAELSIRDDTPMGFYFKFREKRPYLLKKGRDLHAVKVKGPSEEKYFLAFEKGLHHLKRGDCYQYNLTFPFMIEFSAMAASDFLAHCWRRKECVGQFASFTSIEGVEDSLFSNSPECLFQIRKDDEAFLVETFPIKGTQRIENDDEGQAWRLLSSSEKDESELFMITDLMRSDLSRLSGKWADVIAKKEKMKVPGLLHSYSHLQSTLKPETTLLNIVECLFPGGSITGAPKVSVMKVIDGIEREVRGFYCGSTVIKSGCIFQGSINIRSGTLSCVKGRMRYHSGGGITSRSKPESEYREMWDKVQSFSHLLGSSH
jgi:anthranilate/para-aminobenzoate synthase component I